MTRTERDRPAALAASEASQAAIKRESAKHTPGPWNIGSSDLPVSDLSVHAPDSIGGHTTLCRMAIIHPSVDLVANARLMAAAPELLAALQRLAQSYEWLTPRGGDPTDALKAARAAIHKATGEAE